MGSKHRTGERRMAGDLLGNLQLTVVNDPEKLRAAAKKGRNG